MIEPAAMIDVKTATAYDQLARTTILQHLRTYNRLDWWKLQDWFDHPGLLCIGADVISSAMLIIPTDGQPDQRFDTTNSRTAWLRWCSVADGISATPVLRELFESSKAQLVTAGITTIYALVEDAHWLMPYLVMLDFKRMDGVVTLARNLMGADFAVTATPVPCNIRMATQRDLPSITILDSKAFDEHWQYPYHALARMISPHTYMSDALSGDRTLGYQLTQIDELDAHIIRLAVHPDNQGHGIGSALLTDTLQTLRDQYGVHRVSINTQLSNTVSQSLYARFGFRTMQPMSRVLRYELSASDQQ